MSHFSGGYQNTGYTSGTGQQVPQNQYYQNQNTGYQPQSNYSSPKPQVVTYQSGQIYGGQTNQSAFNQSGNYNQTGGYQAGYNSPGYTQPAYSSQIGPRLGPQIAPVINQDANTGWGQSPPNPNANYSYPNSQNNQNNQNNRGFYSSGYQPQQNVYDDRGSQQLWNSHRGWGSKYQDLVDGSNNNLWRQKYQVKNKSSTVLKLDPNRAYTIHPAIVPQKVLDISKTSIQHKVIIYTNRNQSNQQFRITQQNGYYKLYSVQKYTSVLKVQKQSCGNKANIICDAQNGSPSQQWQILPVSDKQSDGYFIKTFNGRCLDVNEQKTSDGAEVIQYDYNGGKNQIWFIKPV